MFDVFIRPYEERDAGAVAGICHATGYMGTSAESRFKDRTLFGLVFALGYPRFDSASCFVACLDQVVVGYCFAATETTVYQRWVKETHTSAIYRHALKKTLWRSPRDLLHMARWAKAGKGAPDFSAIVAEYPAHLHINVSPGLQGMGIGKRLMGAMLAHLQSVAVPGIHLQTSTRNETALGLYAQLGFKEVARASRTLWGEAGVESVTLARALRAAE